MKIIHPEFEKSISLKDLEIHKEEGVFKIIPKNQKASLDLFLKSFEDYRNERNEKIKEVDLYENLPFSINDKSWKSKRKDIKIVNKLIENKNNLKVLEIGSWNGWLSNYLSLKGHNVVATDIFLDKFDGLKAINHYKSDFIALQLFPNEIWRIKESFDLIIFNRNWAYLEDKELILDSAKELLSKKGKILFTGLAIYTFEEYIKKELKKIKTYFFEKYKIPLLYFETKGYLTKEDLTFFKKKDFKIKKYSPFKFLIKRVLFKKKFNSYYIIYEKS